MNADRHDSGGSAISGVGSMIAMMLVGIVLAIVVSLNRPSAEVSVDIYRGTVEVIHASEVRGAIAPAIAGSDIIASIDA